MSESEFFDAWKRGVQIAGPQWFEGDVETATSKWHLRPDYDLITENIGTMSTGEAAFLLAMYSFYNPSTGAKLLAKRRNDSTGPGGLASLIDGRRRQVIADLLVSYGGW
ncbi:hypothetical protein FHT44_005051 [Mycolicibacterium sp. BK634]|uniref:hypothetical protein n=1 Tax=Mycolicibacterium sp. BK634 TaxID=2587099 RepID=UPI00161C2EA9|nr:hypothetical protein [Mycolicibacterium sp. BK634]MBB3752539.1 hypothetical protein [Mycolicibacterium sp. BK634]